MAWRRCALVLALVPGCFFELRGSTSTPRHPLHDNAQGGLEGGLAFGTGYIDKQQAAVVELGIGGSPLRRRDPIGMLGAGVTLALSQNATSHELVGAVAGLGVGVVYQSVHDDALGPGSFIGIELSAILGGDLLSAMSEAAKKHD